MKLIDDKFVALQANQSIAGLSNFWLGSASSDTGTAPPVQQLPATDKTAPRTLICLPLWPLPR